MKSGGKNIAETMEEKIAAFKKMDRKEFIEQNMTFYTKYKKSLDELALLEKKKELKEKNIELHWGVSGGGKTHGCYAKYDIDSIYKYIYSSTGLWFDGYDPLKHKTLLIDEFNGQIPCTTLLQMLDKYPMMVDVKGGRLPFMFENIYIASNYHPKNWYTNVGTPSLSALARRLKGKVTHYEKPYETIEEVNIEDL